MEKSVVSAFGVVLRRLRIEANLTQEQLGMEANIQRKHISALELGDKQASLSTVFKLAKALKIKPAKLIQLVDNELS